MTRAVRRAVLLAALLLAAPPAYAGWLDQALQQAGQLGLGAQGAGLDEREIVRGLREALKKGTTSAVRRLGRKDGYWGDPRVRIPLPERLQAPARLLRKAGFGSLVDDLARRMNRAAEAAAPKAAPIFMDALRRMTWRDARRIWKGPDDAATRYFRRSTEARLARAFAPVVHRELDRSGAIRAWRRFARQFAALPLVGDRLHDDPDAWVTGKALDGLFLMLAREEARIRHDPAARTSAILRKVFGAL